MSHTPLSNILSITAKIRQRVNAGYSLNTLLPEALHTLPTEDRSLAQAILYQSVRLTARNRLLLKELCSREPSKEIQALAECSLASMTLNTLKPFTVVNEAVTAAKSDPTTQKASGFLNAVLRNYLRNQARLESSVGHSIECRYNAPQWWIDTIKTAHPVAWRHILELATLPPPLTLRVNARRNTVADYLKQLNNVDIVARQVGPDAVTLEKPLPVDQIPGFREGVVSVQDAGAQLAAHLLPITSGMRVLDACAAPGGKTAHILERADVELTALEIDPKRTERITENLTRLGLHANVLTADGNQPESWWDKRPYDAVLLDAPCTASGVVRRQPDTPWLRRKNDIKHLAQQQHNLLETLWPLVKPNGVLLYATCSIFPEEGLRQIQQFLDRHDEAKLSPLCPDNHGMMVLLPNDTIYEPGSSLPSVNDGFFYALIQKEV